MLECLRAYLLDQEGDHFDLIVSDIRMPGLSGMELLHAGREAEAFPPTILITSFGDRETHREARRLGARALIDKPFELDTLIEEVTLALAGRAHHP
jgi:DNA-binding NtrC family response regulator